MSDYRLSSILGKMRKHKEYLAIWISSVAMSIVVLFFIIFYMITRSYGGPGDFGGGIVIFFGTMACVILAVTIIINLIFHPDYSKYNAFEIKLYATIAVFVSSIILSYLIPLIKFNMM
jgi:hypothetical protein